MCPITPTADSVSHGWPGPGHDGTCTTTTPSTSWGVGGRRSPDEATRHVQGFDPDFRLQAWFRMPGSASSLQGPMEKLS